MAKNDPRTIKITARFNRAEAIEVRNNQDQSGAPNVSEFLRASALCRRDVEISRFDLQKLWGEAIKLSGRVAAAEPCREQRAALGAAKIFFAAAAELVLRANRRHSG